MRERNRLLSLLLTLCLFVSLAAPAAAAYTAVSMQLTKTSGTVTISKSNGTNVTVRSGMRLYNGYHVTTAEKSYAWISLDHAKLIKVDASSSAEVRKNGDQLEVNVAYGSVFFEVTEKLNSNETLNISSSTMTVGVRGTSGWVRVTDQWVTQVCLLEGTAQCAVADPVTCQLKSARLSGGDVARCVVYPQDRVGDKCDILMEQQTTGGIPGFVLTELTENAELCDKILDDSGLDILADLAKTAGGNPSGRTNNGKDASSEVKRESNTRQDREERETGQKLEQIQQEQSKQENNISKDPVWEQGQQPQQPEKPSGGSSGSGSGSGSSPTTPDTPEPAPKIYTITFYSSGGITAQTNADGKLTSLPTITKSPDGKDDFVKWVLYGGSEVTLDTVFNYDETVYPVWKENPPYTVFLDPNGAEWPERDTEGTITTDGVTLNIPASFPNSMDRNGIHYNRTGWEIVRDYPYSRAPEITYYSSPSDIAGDCTLRAEWGSAYISVFWDLNGGVWSVTNDSTTIVHGGISINPGEGVTSSYSIRGWGEPTRSGYTFDGWFTDPTGGTEVTPNSTLFYRDTTVYAHWTQDSVTWSLDDTTKKLTISGTGAIGDYSSGWVSMAGADVTNAPWGSSGNNWLNIETVAIEDGITSIGNCAFSGLVCATSVTIADSVKSIGRSAFSECELLASVTISNNVNSIGDYAFDGCKDLISITIPTGVTSIGTGVFRYCSALTSVEIPTGVTSIGDSAFMACNSLTSITIPSSVTSISSNVFDSCTGGLNINFGGSQATWDSFGVTLPSGATVTCTP